MSEAVRLQDPDSELKHSEDWSDWLVSGDTIDTSDWSITPSGPSIGGEDHDATTTTAILSAVGFGKTYELRNTVVTALGETETRSIIIRGTRT